jgi:hypothetical protein
MVDLFAFRYFLCVIDFRGGRLASGQPEQHARYASSTSHIQLHSCVDIEQQTLYEYAAPIRTSERRGHKHQVTQRGRAAVLGSLATALQWRLSTDARVVQNTCSKR